MRRSALFSDDNRVSSSLSPLYCSGVGEILSAAGTPYFPDLRGKILCIEEMAAPFSRLERNLTQLRLMGVWEEIEGLLFGKVEFLDPQGAPFSLYDLLCACIGQREYPIIADFDLAHTYPMFTLGQRTLVSIRAKERYDVVFEVLEAMVGIG